MGVRRKTCALHVYYTPGCDECRIASRDYQRQQKNRRLAPVLLTRSAAAEAAARRTVHRLQAMDEYDIARRCEQILAAFHGPVINVRPERPAAEESAA